MTITPHNLATTGYSTAELAATAAETHLAEWDNGYTDYMVFAYDGIYGTLFEIVFTRPVQVAA